MLALVQNVGLGLVLHQTILSRDHLREIGVQLLDSVNPCFPSLCMEQVKEQPLNPSNISEYGMTSLLT